LPTIFSTFSCITPPTDAKKASIETKAKPEEWKFSASLKARWVNPRQEYGDLIPPKQ